MKKLFVMFLLGSGSITFAKHYDDHDDHRHRHNDFSCSTGSCSTRQREQAVTFSSSSGPCKARICQVCQDCPM